MLKNYLNSIEPRVIFIISTITLSIIGLLMVFSSSSIVAMENHADSFFYLKRQGLFLLMGLVIMGACSSINTNILSKNHKFFYIIGIVLLILVLVPILGRKSGGATRWIQVFSFSLQPIEIAKYMLLIFTHIFTIIFLLKLLIATSVAWGDVDFESLIIILFLLIL